MKLTIICNQCNQQKVTMLLMLTKFLGGSAFVKSNFFLLKKPRISSLLSSQPTWTKRENDILFDDSNILNESNELYDSVSDYDYNFGNNNSIYSISDLSILEVCELYKFSLAYLGDYLIQIGCTPPIDIHDTLQSYMTASQIRYLLRAIHSLTVDEANMGYDDESVEQIAESLGVTVMDILERCVKHGFNLPFGKDTVLHKSLSDKLRELNDVTIDPHQ